MLDILNDEQVEGIKKVSTTWMEGTKVLGYWPNGRSIVFWKDETVICVGLNFLRRVLEAADAMERARQATVDEAEKAKQEPPLSQLAEENGSNPS